ncbi:MAG: MFS transporter, partial [Eubacteriales bacterium]|nr:MFS transporter [Eubacteriales bacterium]
LMPGTLPIIFEIALFSLGFAFGSVAIPIIAMAAFGERSFSRVNGMFMTATGIAAAMGPVFSGYICDTTGSYAGSYRAYVVIAAVFTVVIILCLAKKEKVLNRT